MEVVKNIGKPKISMLKYFMFLKLILGCKTILKINNKNFRRTKKNYDFHSIFKIKKKFHAKDTFIKKNTFHSKRITKHSK